MGGFFGTVSRKNCKYEVFFGTDYHSHLGNRRGGMAFYDKEKVMAAYETAVEEKYRFFSFGDAMLIV